MRSWCPTVAVRRARPLAVDAAVNVVDAPLVGTMAPIFADDSVHFTGASVGLP